MMTFKKIYKLSIVAVSLLILGISCDSENEGDTNDNAITVSVAEGRQQQINTLYDNQIVPQQAQHIALTTALQNNAIAFSNTPSATTLNDLKTAWETAFLQWKQMEYYDIDVARSFLHARIHEWPVNETFIEDHIAGTATLDSDFINGIGASSKGYGAIEYLLYQEDEVTTLLDFTANPNFERRMAFLLALTENLKEKAEELETFWKEEEADFKSRLETGVNGSQNQIVNAIVAGLETIKLQKIGQSESSITDASSMETFRSETSKEAVANNLLALEETYTGDFSSEGFGMEEFVEQALGNAQLDATIKNAFAEAIAALDAINTTLEEAVVNNATDLVAFREALTELIARIKTDLASAANIVVTFNDNDGDTG